MATTDFTADVDANGQFGSATDHVKMDTGESGGHEDGGAAEDHLGGVEVAASGGDGECGAAVPRGTDDNAGEERKLFVGGLSWETNENDLKTYFEKFGEVESVNLKMDPVTGKSRCFAFIVYKEGAGLSACFAGGEHAINSKKVDVKKARAKPGKIFVGGLKPEMTDEEIKGFFEQFGAVIETEMPYDKMKKQRKG